MNLSFLKNKSVLIGLSLSIFILILVILFSPKKSSTPESNTNIPDLRPDRTELIDLSKEKRDQAMIYVESIEKKLPLYLESYQTTPKIVITINIYRLKDDPAEVVRLEIYGLSYLNQETDPTKNPNVVAFKEGYVKAMEMLESQNIDPKKLIFIYGDKEYVRKTTIHWIDKLGLKP